MLFGLIFDLIIGFVLVCAVLWWLIEFIFGLIDGIFDEPDDKSRK